MVNYQLVTIKNYNDGSLVLWGRSDYNTKRKFIVKGFRPYFYVSTAEEIIQDKRIVEIETNKVYTSIFKKPYTRIYCKQPGDISGSQDRGVKGLRDYYKDTAEDNVSYTLRFLIDKGITNGFFFEGYISNRGLVHHDAIRAVEFRLDPLLCMTDIEVYSPKKVFPQAEDPIFKIIAVTVWDSKYKKYVTFFLRNSEFIISSEMKKRMGKDWLLLNFISEESLLEEVFKYLKYIDFDLISGWNVDFDVDYLFARAKYLGIENDLEGFDKFDLLSFYKKIKNRSLGNRLKDVVIEEGFVEDESQLEAAEFDNKLYELVDLWNVLIKYNFDDVRYCNLINWKFLIDVYFWDIKNTSGLDEINSTQYNSRIIRRIMLGLIHNEVVIPHNKTKQRRYKAAINIKPLPGIYHNVASLDFTRHFPSTIIMGNHSIEYKGLTLAQRLKLPLGIMGRIAKVLIDNRAVQDRKLDEYLKDPLLGPESQQYKTQVNRRNSAKFLLNAAYGVFGMPSFDLYDADVVEAMVKMAMDGLRKLKESVEELGYKVIQGHTDNVMVSIERDKVDELLEHVNNRLRDYAISLGMEPLWQVKFEMYAKTVVFAPAKANEERGAVTRYAAQIIEKDYVPVKPYMFVKGFEIVRGDQSPITKEIQRSLFNAIFNDTLDQYIQELRKLIKDIQKGKIDIDKIASRVNIGKSQKEYKVRNDKFKAVENAKDLLGLDIKKGDRVKIVFLGKRHGPKYEQPLAYFEKSDLTKNNIDINYDLLIDKNIRLKITNLLDISGHDWVNLSGIKQTSLKDLL